MSDESRSRGAYSADNGLVDYILGITFEIWEQGQTELIHQYYSKDARIFALDGLVAGAAQMVEGTRSVLAAFPDRLLLGDDVIWSGNALDGYYSSHRVVSPMTNLGPSAFGPATGKAVRIMNMADCIVEGGVITREWLVRDNHALVTQLGFEPVACAQIVKERCGPDLRDWLANEHQRLVAVGLPTTGSVLVEPSGNPELFAQQVVECLWSSGTSGLLGTAHAPYAVLHRSPVKVISGRNAIADHFAALRGAFTVTGVVVDHLAAQPYGVDGLHLAVRWAVAASHSGEYQGISASGKPVYILGVSHWRIVEERIAVDWTVFDALGVMAQLLD